MLLLSATCFFSIFVEVTWAKNFSRSGWTQLWITIGAGSVEFGQNQSRGVGWSYEPGLRIQYHQRPACNFYPSIRKTPGSRCVVIPLWIPLVFVVVATYRFWRFEGRAEQRVKRGCCPKCGYDRRGIVASVVCPECGEAPMR